MYFNHRWIILITLVFERQGITDISLRKGALTKSISRLMERWLFIPLQRPLPYPSSLNFKYHCSLLRPLSFRHGTRIVKIFNVTTFSRHISYQEQRSIYNQTVAFIVQRYSEQTSTLIFFQILLFVLEIYLKYLQNQTHTRFTNYRNYATNHDLDIHIQSPN